MRVNHVTSARKSPGPCSACRKPIEAGQAYKWIKGRYTAKSIRHETCPDWKASEMTGSDKLSRLYSAKESVEDAINEFSEDASDLRSALEEAASEAQDVAQEYTDAAEACAAIRDQCEEYASSAENFGSECDSTAGDIEDFDEDAAREEARGEVTGEEDQDDDATEPVLIPEALYEFVPWFNQYMAPYRRTFRKVVRKPSGYAWGPVETEVKAVEDWAYGLGPCSEIRRDEARADLDALVRTVAEAPRKIRRKLWERLSTHLSSLAGSRKLGRTLKAYVVDGRHSEVWNTALEAKGEADEDADLPAEQREEIDRMVEEKREEWADAVREAAQNAVDSLDI